MRLVVALACAVILTLAGMAPGYAEKRVALVIGNGAYQRADRLANPITDARRIREALAKLNFEIVYGEDLGKQQLERMIGRFANVAQDADVALVFFAGHGATFGDVPYVVPVDAQFSSLGEIPYELMPVETMIGELRRAKGLRIAILDACRDNSAERDLKRVAARGGDITRGLGRVRNPEGLILAYATQYLSTAADGNPDGDSPFTTALLNNIATPGLDVKDLFFKVGQEVMTSTKGAQQPEISISFYDSYTLVPPEPVTTASPSIASPPQDSARRRVALVVGNDRYVNLAVDQQLRKAVSDSRAVGDALATLGFEVIRGENLSRQAMVDKIDDLTRKLSPGDMAFFFFSGHGVAIEHGNYILPSDVPNIQEGQDIRLAGASLGESDIVADLQGRGVRVAVLVLDACRTNPFKRAGQRAVGGERGLKQIGEVQGVFTLYSAGLGQSALDELGQSDANPNSIFTRVLVPALRKTGLDLGGLAIEVREEVARLARTVGHEQNPAYYDGTSGGRIYLAGLPKRDVSSQEGSPVLGRPPTADRCASAETHWRSAEAIATIAAFEDHLTRFPECAFAGLARARIEHLKKNQVGASLVEQSSGEMMIDDPGVLREIRDRLYELNFDPGPFDGPMNDDTRRAIREFEAKSQLPETGQPTEWLLRRLREVGALKPWGAIVYDRVTNKWGMSWDRVSRKDAVNSARSSCGGSQCAAEISFFGNECGAFAHSSSGWAIVARTDIQRSKQAALGDCRNHGRTCRIVASVCADGTERFDAGE
jgi:uncharacterized caspase-like protein